MKRRRVGDDELAEVVGTAVLGAYHPSAAHSDTAPTLRHVRWTYPGTDRAHLELRLDYLEIIADIAVRFYAPKGVVEVLGIDYADNALGPPDAATGRRVVRELSEQLGAPQLKRR